jgi:iron complex outermembrane receptor protein
LSWGFGKRGTSLRLSGSYDDQKGIVKNSALKRLTGRANFSQKFLKDKFKFEALLTYSNTKNEYPPLTNNAGYQGSLVGAAITFNPTYPIFDSTGAYYDPKDGNRNPVEMLAYFEDKDNINRYLSNLSLTWQIFSNLSYKVVFGYDRSKSERLSFADPRLSSNAFGGTNTIFGVNLNNPISGNGRAFKQNLDLKSLLLEHYLTYDKSFAGGHVINAIAGYSYQSYETDYAGRIAWGLNTPVVSPTDNFVKDFNNFTDYYDDIPNFSKSVLQSYFGRVNYSLLDKYFLTATVRADGSSKFGLNNKYGVFPAFAAKWRLIRENFAESLGNIFSDLSIRVNYGILGSQEGIGAYDAVNLRQVYKGNNTDHDTSFIHSGNPDLKWEEAATTGVGLDYASRNSRFSGSIDYYYTKRKNLLFYGPTPGGFAATSNWFTNLPGFVINTGLELSLNVIPVKTNKFTWNVNYNMTFMHNVVRDFGQIVNTGAVNGQGLSGAYAQTIVDDYSLFTWKMPVFEGFDKDGFAIYANGGTDQLLGSALPKFTAGLTNSFTFGQFSASIFLNAVTGFYVYNNTANALFLKGSLKTGHNLTYDVATSPESPINPGSVSTRFLEKGDFVRLSNVNLSYALDIKNKNVIKAFSIFVSGQNLALITDYSGLDPEVNTDHNINGIPSRGFDYTAYPKPRTFTLGINLGF